MAIIETARKEIIRLEKMLRKIDAFLSDAPDGCLKWQNKKEKTYYYQQYLDNDVKTEGNANDSNKWNRRYIKKDNLGFARALAQKHYYSLVKPIAEKQLRELRKFVNKYPNDSIDEIYDSLSVERKNLVQPLQVSVQQRIKQWKEEIYEKNDKYPENLKFETEQGEKVRSKSEVIIANLLYQNRGHILYKYERPLNLMVDGKMKTIYPDFTILNIRTGKIIYWEHAGRMDDPYYANDFVRKMNTYVANDLLPGKDVILTYESQANPLEITVVKRWLQEIS